jgi:hypothetical protein
MISEGLAGSYLDSTLDVLAKRTENEILSWTMNSLKNN